jgi:hypothetical protein
MTPEHERVIEKLRSSAAAVAAAVRSVPAGKARQAPAAGEWSVHETLAHARNVAVLCLGLRVKRLLYERDPVFGDYDDEPIRRDAVARPEPLEQVLEMLVTEHAQLAGLLSRLPDAEWKRSGRHPERGELSIEMMAGFAGEHAEEHAGQIAKAEAALRTGGL